MYIRSSRRITIYAKSIGKNKMSNLENSEQVSKDITTPSPPLTNQKEKPFFVENYHKLYIILKKIICTNWLK